MKKPILIVKEKIKRDDIRFNFKHKHIAHVKKVKGKPPNQTVTSVFISSKECDGNSQNIKMKKSILVDRPSYFIKRIRTYNSESYSKKVARVKLSRADKKTSQKIYKISLKNKK